MAENIKQIADELAKKEGRTRGETLLTRLSYIRTRVGEPGIKKLEKKFDELDYSFDFSKVKSLGWYPEYIGVLIILVAKDLFNWTDKDIFAMGSYGPKVSFLVKMLMKYFITVEMTFKASSVNWKKHHSSGDLKLGKFDSQKKQAVLKLIDYNFHPIMCEYLRGYFLEFAKLVLHTEEVEFTSIINEEDGKLVYIFEMTWK